MILFTVVPVMVVFSALFLLIVSHVRSHLSLNAQEWLAEHAQHQAARLALTLSQVPLLAESLGDLMLADPGQSQTLIYAHLIDGLRRTPLANTAAIINRETGRGAMMRRGDSVGRPLATGVDGTTAPGAGWHIHDDGLRFSRPLFGRGEHLGDTWIQVRISDVYAELKRQQIPTVSLLVSLDDGTLLQADNSPAQHAALSTTSPLDHPAGKVATIVSGDGRDTAYWMISTQLPGCPYISPRLFRPRPRCSPPTRGPSRWQARWSWHCC